MPCEAAEEFGVFGHRAHLNLKDGKALLDRGELLKELFLSDFPFRETVFVFVLSVIAARHDNAPLVGLMEERGGLLVCIRRLGSKIWRSPDDQRRFESHRSRDVVEIG